MGLFIAEANATAKALNIPREGLSIGYRFSSLIEAARVRE